MAEWNVWRWLGLEPPARERDVLDSTIDILEHLDPDRARYVAGFAYLLGRVAGADSQVSGDETALMKRLVMEEGGTAKPRRWSALRSRTTGGSAARTT